MTQHAFSSAPVLAQHVLGQSNDFIIDQCSENIRCPIHRNIVAPFLALQKDAKAAGFDLQLVSGFRDYQRQLKIWSDKAQGKRALLDIDGNALDFAALSEEELLSAIMRWSALPGASRHHWGTDVDVYDASAVAADYNVQLTKQEVEGDGPFAPLHDWLDKRLQNNQAHGFFRPYARDKGGVSPERWHLSFAPLALEFQKQLSKDILFEAWQQSDLPLLSQVQERWDDIWQRYIWIDKDSYPNDVVGLE